MHKHQICIHYFHRLYSTKQPKEIFSNSVVRKFKSNKVKQKPNKNEPLENIPKPRLNHVNIQMLSKSLYQQLFDESLNKEIPPEILEKSFESFEKHQINIKDVNPVPDVNFKLPKLSGQSLEEHFWNIGEEQSKSYRQLIDKMIAGKLVSKPGEWLYVPGWTRYEPGKAPSSIDYPIEDCIIFDVEVCVSAGPSPILATAVTDKAWYAWVSPNLTSNQPDNPFNLPNLIPLESSLNQHFKDLNPTKPRVVIGHNVSYDRVRVKEQYWLKPTNTRFVDTMSLHICTSGVTSYQRALLKSKDLDLSDEKWLNCSSLNSLADVYKLYCGKELSKETRNIFVKGDLEDVREEFQSVMMYCSSDVEATFQVLQKLFPLFLERFPHPVTFAGMLELGTAYLPVNQNWTKYINTAEATYENFENEMISLLAQKANDALKLQENEKYKEDLWMWDQDWSPKKPRKNSTEIEKKYAELPAWYRKLCTKPVDPDWVPNPILISTSMRITPKLLRLTWEGFPLHFVAGHGWGFLVPFTTDLDRAENIPLKQLIEKCPILSLDRDDTSTPNMDNLVTDVEVNLGKREYYSKVKEDKTNGVYKGSGIWAKLILEECCYFLKLPHKDGVSHRVGNPLSKDFLTKFSENVLAGDDDTANGVLSNGRMLTYWRNNRDRINQQHVGWLMEDDLPDNIKFQGFEAKYGAIIPQVVVCGTLTRRAVEPTWMTASNAHIDRIGSELRGFVQAPPGYNIVGADVDSQELWIASAIGDADVTQVSGITPLGWMTLSGSKSKGTDMHSVTANAIGISRDHAKVINYARIYGAGQNFAESLLKQFNPTITPNEARKKALKMFELTKGKRYYRIKVEYLQDFEDRLYTHWEAFKLAKLHGKGLGDMFFKPKWIGGTESAMFNRLEEIASDSTPATPFLNGRLSRALEPQTLSDDRFLPTRVNWVVQSGAVDYLHLMLVSMKWLMKDNIRFVLSFHDEIRYLVPEGYKYKAALAMHITNLLTRSFCVSKLGLNDLPMSVAFFTSVEVDTCLRKECTQECITPSNPDGLEKAYGIPKGESVDIYTALKKCNNEFKFE